MIFSVAVGDFLFLNLQLWDESRSMPKRVFVELSEPNGTLLEAKFEIAHILNGDFRDDTRVMPSKDYVVAQYFVYENDGVTLDEDYTVGKDIFMQSATITINNNQPISGYVDTGSIDGYVETSDISGTITDEYEITGVVIDEC